jgi:N-acetylmuramoyl-L-alanine amidase
MSQGAERRPVTRQRQSKEPYFRWDALDWLQRTSATVAVLIVLTIVALLAYSFTAPARAADAPGRPHAPAPLAIFVRPTSTPRPTRSGPTPIPTVMIPRIGIVSGHHGNDSGAVCKDGLTEAQVNYDIANRVAGEMRQRGYRVDVLDEFDPRLNNYGALLLLSIHADSCDYINEEATGFKVAHVLDSRVPEQEDKLVECIADRYAARTGMRFHKNSVTRDMTNYHGFYEVAPNTPSAIIETGFLQLDRLILTERADLVAQGIVDGLMCYLSVRGTP